METNHPNIELIGKFFGAYANNDHEQVGEILSEDIQWHIPGNHPLCGTKKGINEVLHYLKQLNKASFKASPIVAGVNDNYVIDCHRNWSNLDGEENLNNMSCLLWKIENNKITEVYNFPENQHKVDEFFNNVYGK
jgi:ketosteroid isomerase-like protein